MNYIVYTPSAVKLKKEILDRVSEKLDANSKGIATWQCVVTDTGEKVLLHTTDQWAEKGCLVLNQEDIRNELQVRFHYWDSCEGKIEGVDIDWPEDFEFAKQLIKCYKI